MMPDYRIHIRNGLPENHLLTLANDAMAVEEALRTAAELVRDVTLAQAGQEQSLVEVFDDGDTPVFRIRIEVVRSR